MKKEEPNNPISYQFMYLNNMEFELDCVDYKLKKGKLVIEESLVDEKMENDEK